MTESLPPDAEAKHAADAPAAPITRPDAEPFDFVPTEPVVPTGPPPATARPGRGPAVALGYLAAALAGALLLGGSLVAFGGVGRSAPSPSPTPTPPPNAADGPSLGSAAAPVTIEVWADYQCPYCVSRRWSSAVPWSERTCCPASRGSFTATSCSWARSPSTPRWPPGAPAPRIRAPTGATTTSCSPRSRVRTRVRSSGRTSSPWPGSRPSTRRRSPPASTIRRSRRQSRTRRPRAVRPASSPPRPCASAVRAERESCPGSVPAGRPSAMPWQRSRRRHRPRARPRPRARHREAAPPRSAAPPRWRRRYRRRRRSRSARGREIPAREDPRGPRDRRREDRAEDQQVTQLEGAGQDPRRLEVTERRVRPKPRRVRPERAQELDCVPDERDAQRDSHGRPQPVEAHRRSQRDGPERAEERHRVEPAERDVDRPEIAGHPEQERACHDAAQDGRLREGGEEDRRGQERRVEDPALQRPCEEHLQRAALALARDGSRREPDHLDRHEGERDRVDEPERDSSPDAEDVAAGEAREDVDDIRERAALDQGAHVLPERGVDHREQEPPYRERKHHEEQADALRRPRPPEEDPAHGAGSSYSSRNASSRRAGSIVRSASGAPWRRRRSGATSPSSPNASRSSRASNAETPGRAASAAARAGTGASSRASTCRRRRARSAAMLSSATSRPSRMIATRSQTRSTSESTWELKNTVLPAAFRSSRIA